MQTVIHSTGVTRGGQEQLTRAPVPSITLSTFSNVSSSSTVPSHFLFIMIIIFLSAFMFPAN